MKDKYIGKLTTKNRDRYENNVDNAVKYYNQKKDSKFFENKNSRDTVI